MAKHLLQAREDVADLSVGQGGSDETRHLLVGRIVVTQDHLQGIRMDELGDTADNY